jgi:hypothetical protein
MAAWYGNHAADARRTKKPSHMLRDFIGHGLYELGVRIQLHDLQRAELMLFDCLAPRSQRHVRHVLAVAERRSLKQGLEQELGRGVVARLRRKIEYLLRVFAQAGMLDAVCAGSTNDMPCGFTRIESASQHASNSGT